MKKLPENVSIININEIKFIEKDLVEIKDFEGFLIALHEFSFKMVLNLNGVYYLVGSEVVYYYKNP